MKYLLINASPRLGESNSLVLTSVLLEGAGWKYAERIDLYKLIVGGFCQRCFSCWKDTPRQCIVRKRLELFYQAGAKYARMGSISKNIQRAVTRPIIPIKLYIEKAQQSFAKREDLYV